jgi:hypothetical protein
MPNQNDQLWFIEAKSSVPRDLSVEVQKIRSKLTNAASLFLALRLGLHAKHRDELPQAMRDAALTFDCVQFVWIVRDCPKSELPPLCDALVKAMLPTLKIWGMSSLQVKAFNQDRARQKQWLSP